MGEDASEYSGKVLTDGIVTLRAWVEDDIPRLVEALDDKEVSLWIPRIPWPYTNDDARDFVGRIAPREGALAIMDARGTRLLGGAGLHPLAFGVGSIGYWVVGDARRRGIATRAVRLLVAWAFEDLGLARLELTADVENYASQRVAEKNGFRREGRLRSNVETRKGRRDSFIYGLLPSDSTPARAGEGEGAT